MQSECVIKEPAGQTLRKTGMVKGFLINASHVSNQETPLLFCFDNDTTCEVKSNQLIVIRTHQLNL